MPEVTIQEFVELWDERWKSINKAFQDQREILVALQKKSRSEIEESEMKRIRTKKEEELALVSQLYKHLWVIRDETSKARDVAGKVMEQRHVDELDRIGGIANELIAPLMEKVDSIEGFK